MPNVEINTETLKKRIETLTKEVKDIYDRRRFYGESGFRRSKLTDNLLRDARQKEAIIKEYESLLREAKQ